MRTNRSVLVTTTLIESAGPPEMHARTVQWTANQIKNSTQYVKGDVFITSHPYDKDTGVSYGFSGSGKEPSAETQEIINDLFDV